MIKGLRVILRDKTVFREQDGILRQAGRPMDILQKIPEDVKILHIVDLNAKDGNMTNLDLYDNMTYKLNIEVECAPKEEILRKLFALGTRAVLDLPCPIDLKKFEKKKRLLVGKVTGEERDEGVFDYYAESEDAATIAKIAKKKRVLVYSKKLSDEEAEKAGAFAIIRDY